MLSSAEHDVKAILSITAHAHHTLTTTSLVQIPSCMNVERHQERSTRATALFAPSTPNRAEISQFLYCTFSIKKCHSLTFPITATIEQFYSPLFWWQEKYMAGREEAMLASHFQLLQRNELFPSKENVNFISKEHSHKEPEESSPRLDCASWKWGRRALAVLPCLKIRYFTTTLSSPNF